MPQVQWPYIGGKWKPVSRQIEVVSPGTTEVIGLVGQCSPEDVREAVAVARTAGAGWRALPVEERCSYLTRLADLIVEQYGTELEWTPLKRLISSEMGKRLPEADIEVIETSDMVRYFADHAPVLLADQPIPIESDMWAKKKSTLVFEPRGVVAVIKPWNYPLEIPLWSIAPALAAGNTVVFKPSELATLVGMEIAKLLDQTKLPPGVFNVVPGGPAVGESLAECSDVNMVSFTGSVATGRKVAAAAARNGAYASLELGGADPAIVLDDADLELAANGVVWGSICNTGQVCVGIKRVYVHQKIASQFVSAVAERVSKLRFGTDYGPIVSSRQYDSIQAMLEEAAASGAKVSMSDSADATTLHLPPTVVTNVSNDMRLLAEECFGPVIPIQTFDGDAEAIALANESNYALGASIWSSNETRAIEMSRALQAGMVWINDVNVALAEAPWGGYKQSGPGIDLSPWGLYEYTARKHINSEFSPDRSRDWWYPY